MSSSSNRRFTLIAPQKLDVASETEKMRQERKRILKVKKGVVGFKEEQPQTAGSPKILLFTELIFLLLVAKKFKKFSPESQIRNH